METTCWLIDYLLADQTTYRLTDWLMVALFSSLFKFYIDFIFACRRMVRDHDYMRWSERGRKEAFLACVKPLVPKLRKISCAHPENPPDTSLTGYLSVCSWPDLSKQFCVCSLERFFAVTQSHVSTGTRHFFWSRRKKPLQPREVIMITVTWSYSMARLAMTVKGFTASGCHKVF